MPGFPPAQISATANRPRPLIELCLRRNTGIVSANGLRGDYSGEVGSVPEMREG